MRQRRRGSDPRAGRLPAVPHAPGTRQHPATHALAGLLLAVLVAVSACGGSPSGSARPSATTPHTTAAQAAPRPPAPSPSAAPGSPQSCADRVLARMPLAQRVGQLFVVGLAGSVLDSATAQAIRTFHFGSASFIATDAAGVVGVGAVTRAVQA